MRLMTPSLSAGDVGLEFAQQPAESEASAELRLD